MYVLPASVVIPFVSLLQESPCKPGIICSGCLGRKKPLRFRPNVSSANHVAPDQQRQRGFTGETAKHKQT